ncbi:MAG: catalase [Erysipelotrichaceae bacterium]|nr:catalase [Erysipelotrichaceae bacterium]
MNAVGHFKTITKHKVKVGQLCFRLGLYKQGLLHDMSKYMPVEFMTGVKYYRGTYSPNSAERNEKGYSLAWLHHKGHNMHHWEFWVDFGSQGIITARMPYRYVLEMFCDRVAASMVYQGDNYNDHHPLAYYEEKCHYYYLHPETKALLEYLLHYLNRRGLDETIAMIKTHHDYEDYQLTIEKRD